MAQAMKARKTGVLVLGPLDEGLIRKEIGFAKDFAPRIFGFLLVLSRVSSMVYAFFPESFAVS